MEVHSVTMRKVITSEKITEIGVIRLTVYYDKKKSFPRSLINYCHSQKKVGHIYGTFLLIYLQSTVKNVSKYHTF